MSLFFNKYLVTKKKNQKFLYFKIGMCKNMYLFCWYTYTLNFFFWILPYEKLVNQRRIWLV